MSEEFILKKMKATPLGGGKYQIFMGAPAQMPLMGGPPPMWEWHHLYGLASMMIHAFQKEKIPSNRKAGQTFEEVPSLPML